MSWFRRLLLLFPHQRRLREQELQEEMQANLRLAIEDARENRLSPDEAERRARRDFGNLTRAQEEARTVHLPGWDVFSHDLRFAVRTLLRNRAFSLVAILSLCLGTGAATALFSVVNAVLLKPLAYHEPSQLVMAREVVAPMAHIYPTLPVNIQHFRFWRDESRIFQSLSAIMSASTWLYAGNDVETVGAASVTANLFQLLGVHPQLGRFFEPEEEKPGKGTGIVISDSLWRRRLGGSASIIGQRIRLADATYSVIGVLPPEFRFPKKDDLGPLAGLAERTDIFLPIQNVNPGWGGDYDFIVLGRLKQGVTQAEAVAELNVIESRIVAEHKLGYGLTAKLTSLHETIGSSVRASLTMLLASVLVLVLIVCVNLANLLLARGSSRTREFSMRIALGASRGRLLSSALTETLLLSVIGGSLGILFAHSALGLFVRYANVDIPRLDEVAIDGYVLSFAFVLSLICGAVFGLIPALRISRTDVQGALRGESHSLSGSRSGLRLREWLVGTEVTLGTVLLFLAGLLTGSLWHVLSVERGFSSERSFDVRISLPSQYQKPQDRTAFFDLVTERIRAIPGVQAVAAASRVPLAGESNVNGVYLGTQGTELLDPATKQMVMVNVRFIGQDYFPALGIPVLQGRPIEAGDRDRNVIVISKRLVEKLWPGQNPLGKRLSSGSGVRDAEIVGVVADVHTTHLDRDPTLMIYFPFWKESQQVRGIVVRSSASPAAVISPVRQAIQSIDPSIPAPKIRLMNELVAESVSQRRLQMTIALLFATSALLLAAIGIYGVITYGVTLRRREIGIRMALGARASAVRKLILWQGLRPVLLGIGAGTLIAIATGYLIRGLLYGVESTNGLILGSVACLLALVAAAACLMPAYSASTIDPAEVLRSE